MKIDLDKRKLVLTLFQQLKTFRQIRSLTGISMQMLEVWKWRYNHKDFAWAEAEEQERKLSPTEQDELVRLHTQEEKSIVELAAAFGVKRSHVTYLIRKFKRKGVKKEKSERQILRELVVSKFRSGEFKSGTALADYFGLNCRTVQRWIRSAKLHECAYHDLVSEEEAGKIMRFSVKTKLSHNAVIKNWVVREFDLKNRSRSNLVRLVDEIHAQGVPVKEACQWLQVCRSSYYRWKQGEIGSSEDPTVEQIRIFQEAHHYAYGAKRMAVHLSRLNHKAVNHKRVARLMKLHGLNSRVRPKRRSFRAPGEAAKYPDSLTDHLQRDFKSDNLMEKMVTDMTFIPVMEGWLVLSAIKDLCSRKVVSYAFGASPSIDLALETIKGLPLQELQGAPAPLLHSDRGSCYTSVEYRKAVSNLGVLCSYSRPGNCHDNACIESFFGQLKSETFYRLSPVERYGLTREEAKRIVENYIEWYNEGRVQKSIGYRSPSDFISSSGALRG